MGRSQQDTEGWQPLDAIKSRRMAPLRDPERSRRCSNTAGTLIHLMNPGETCETACHNTAHYLSTLV